MNRRDFLSGALATGVVGMFGNHSSADEEPPIPIIDAHQHLWDLSRFKLPWIEEGSELDRDYLPADYDKATQGLNVVKAIYMEVDVDPSQQMKEAEWLIDLCKKGKTKTVAGVISGQPHEEGFEKYIRPFKDNPYVKGVRRVLHVDATPSGFCLQDRFVKSMQLLGELGLSFDFCIRPDELPNVAILVGKCPNTQFILDHCGNPRIMEKDLSQWRRDIEKVAKRPNIVCKVSGFIAFAEKGKWTAEDIAPVINHVYDAFGPDRVMFAGDWPVCRRAATFKQWLQGVQEVVADRPFAQRKKLFHDNAARYYRLMG